MKDKYCEKKMLKALETLARNADCIGDDDKRRALDCLIVATRLVIRSTDWE